MADTLNKLNVDETEPYKRRFESFLNSTIESRSNSEKCRDYYDHKQWTPEQVKILEARKQAPIVVNRIQPKVDAMKGLLVDQKADPKAFPRTPKHDKASYAVTDALRYIHDNTDFDAVEEQCAEDYFIEGTCASITEVTGKKREVIVSRIPWDRFYYDPHSMDLHFEDAKYMGIVLWMDLEDAQTEFPDHKEELSTLVETYESSDETFEDKPTTWIDRERKRLKICQEYCLKDGKWQETFFTDKVILSQGDSPYFDEEGTPINPIKAASAYIDRENNRYGPVWFWLDLQNEINHRRSKALHLNSQRQTMSRRGAITNIHEMKNELAKADGHVEYDGEQGDFDILQTNDMSQAQFALLAEAKQELDAVSINAQLSGERQGDLSGKAIRSLQAGGMLELTPVMGGMQRWRRHNFEQMWLRVRQFWNEERWIRVTDDYNSLRWVGINQKLSVRDVLTEIIEDESKPPEEREIAASQLQMMMQQQDPRLNTYIEVKNEMADLEMDIIIDIMPDSLTIQAEQFEILAQLAGSRPEIPFSAILKLSQIREKEAILSDLEAQVEASSQLQQVQTELEVEDKQADIENKRMDTAQKEQKTQQIALENQVLLETPITSANVSV